ncbi:MAG: hypothetical protein RL357_252 [Pseudomonadota bacterium]
MRLLPALSQPTFPLHSVGATRAIERQLLIDDSDGQWMLKAGEAASRLARAIAPHAKTIAIACGTGHNGGDGYAMAAALCAALNPSDTNIFVMQVGTSAPSSLTQKLRQQALSKGAIEIHEWPKVVDLAVDAMLGIGAQGALRPDVTEVLLQLQKAPILLSLDVPSGLNADSGEWMADERLPSTPSPLQSRYTLGFLTLKPGLMTGAGRDWSGTTWWSDLGASWDNQLDNQPSAVFHNQGASQVRHAHQSHKGSYGDVVVLAGQAPDAHRAGMLGAGALAARAALHSGAGRVTWVPLGSADIGSPLWDPMQPDVMVRQPDQWRQEPHNAREVWVVGSGGGDAVADVLPMALSHPGPLVVDADALNHMAVNSSLLDDFARRGQQDHLQVFTPHPLEAGRLLGLTSAQVQRDRLGCAAHLANTLCGVVVLKGSGSIIAAPGLTPLLNASGNARLATGGTGDVLAGAIAGRLAAQSPATWAICQSLVATTVWEHGHFADRWPTNQGLTASRLTQAFCRP